MERCVRSARWVAANLLSLAIIAVAAPPKAHACSCLPFAIVQADPEDGARDVPLNRALVVRGLFDASRTRLETDGGEAVEFVLNQGPWLGGCAGTWAELIPKHALAPNARYRIRVVPIATNVDVGPTELEFTTGKAVLEDKPLSPPTARVSVLFDTPPAMCGPGNSVVVCLGIEDWHNVELVIRKGDEILMRTDTVVQDSGVYALREIPDCVELVRRSDTGKRSEPLRLCGDALSARPHAAGDSHLGVIDCRSGRIGAGATDRGEGDAGTEVADASVDESASGGKLDSAPEADATGRKAAGCSVGGSDRPADRTQLLLLLAGCAALARRRARSINLRHGRSDTWRATASALVTCAAMGCAPAAAPSPSRGAQNVAADVDAGESGPLPEVAACETHADCTLIAESGCDCSAPRRAVRNDDPAVRAFDQCAERGVTSCPCAPPPPSGGAEVARCIRGTCEVATYTEAELKSCESDAECDARSSAGPCPSCVFRPLDAFAWNRSMPVPGTVGRVLCAPTIGCPACTTPLPAGFRAVCERGVCVPTWDERE